MDGIDNMIGERIRRRRRELGWKQDRIPGFTRSAISMYETGKRIPPPDKLSALAKALGVPLEQLTDTLTVKAGRALRATVENAYLHGDYVDAFRRGRQFQRWARETDDPIQMDQADTLVATITTHMSAGEILDAELQDLPWSSLDSIFHLGRMAQPRQRFMMLMASTWLIRKTPAYTPDFWKAIRDRARLCLELGYFATAAYWYGLATTDTEQSFDRKLQAQISAWNAQSYVGSLDVSANEINLLKQHSIRSPLNWQLYWGFVLHRLWHQRNWVELREAYREAITVYPTGWSSGYRIALLGVEPSSNGSPGRRPPARNGSSRPSPTTMSTAWPASW